MLRAAGSGGPLRGFGAAEIGLEAAGRGAPRALLRACGALQERGVVPKEFFIEGLKGLQVSEVAIESLVQKLVHEDSKGQLSAFRLRQGKSA